MRFVPLASKRKYAPSFISLAGIGEDFRFLAGDR
jgi:hypothetical protein